MWATVTLHSAFLNIHRSGVLNLPRSLVVTQLTPSETAGVTYQWTCSTTKSKGFFKNTPVCLSPCSSKWAKHDGHFADFSRTVFFMMFWLAEVAFTSNTSHQWACITTKSESFVQEYTSLLVCPHALLASRPNTAATFRAFRAHNFLRRSDWLKLSGW